MILSLATIAALRAVRICEIIQDVGGLWYQVLLRIGTQEKFNLACHVILWKDKLDKSHHKWEDVIDMENIKSKIMETQI